MGLFLSLSGVIGKSGGEVTDGIRRYLSAEDVRLEQIEVLDNDRNFCTIEQANGNTTILYPDDFLKWDESSAFLSRELKAPVFSFHIHDGDFWMYVLFVDGEIVDQFMPVPDYFDENVSDEEIASWKGDANILTNYIPGLAAKSVEKYLITWDLDADEIKAYEDDVFANCDWQLIDFLGRLKLPYPLDDDGSPQGTIYKFKTKDTPANPAIYYTNKKESGSSTTGDKPWWKFW